MFLSSNKKFCASADVTFVEKESYFTQLYLQGETSLIEDKDKDLFLLLELDAHHPLSSTNPLALTPIDSQGFPNPNSVSIEAENPCTPDSKFSG